MRFRLTYDGPVYARQDRRAETMPMPLAQHLHGLRQNFHRQLRRLWQTDKFLHEAKRQELPLSESVARMHQQFGYRYVPLVRDHWHLSATIRVLFLRRAAPGRIYAGGDIDNRMKSILDALCKPQYQNQVPCRPNDDEDPFFVLLEDDKLITHLEVETDLLLDPLKASTDDQARAKLVVTVDITATYTTMENLSLLN